MHSLERTVPLVRLSGPLWGYSMFGFKNLNGYFGNTLHGTHKIIYQMGFQIQLAQTLPDKLLELSKAESPETRAYIESVVNKKRTNMTEIAVNCYIIGKTSVHTLTENERSIIDASNLVVHFGNESNVQRFNRIMISNTIYHGQQHSRTTCRNNSLQLLGRRQHTLLWHYFNILSCTTRTTLLLY